MKVLVMLVSATCTLAVVNGVNALIGDKLKRLLKDKVSVFSRVISDTPEIVPLFCGRGLQEPVIFQPDKFCCLYFTFFIRQL